MDTTQSTWHFHRQEGRLRLDLTVRAQGPDLLVQLTGGRAHVGAVALATPGAEAAVLSCPRHREDALARSMAQELARALHCTVCVCAGIHFEAISPAEIRAVQDLSLALTQECRAALQALTAAGGMREEDHAAR